jgi:hypothetical protein
MRPWYFLLFCLLWTGESPAAESVYATASQSESLQKREASARVAALGGNGTSLDAGADSILSNPAAMAGITGLELGAHHQSWLADINQENLTAAGPAFGRWGAWGASLGLVEYGYIEAVDEFGQPLGGVSAQDYSLSLGWARATGTGLSFGGVARVAQESLAGEATTRASMDLGLLWAHGPWRVGVVLADVTSILLTGNGGPSALRAELSGELGSHPGDLRFCGGFSAEPGGLSRLQTGLEGGLYDTLMLRAGYEAKLGDSLVDGFSGASFGLGFALGSSVVDYAFLPFGDLGSGHRISLKWRMKRPATVAPRLALRPRSPVPQPSPTPVATAVPIALPTPVATSVPVAMPMPTPIPTPTADSLQFKVTDDALELARSAEAHGNFEEAVALHESLLGRYPHNPVIWRSLGDLYYRAHRQDEAVKAFDRALEEGLMNQELERWLEKYRSQP